MASPAVACLYRRKFARVSRYLAVRRSVALCRCLKLGAKIIIISTSFADRSFFLIKSLSKLAPHLVALVIDLWYDEIHTERRGFCELDSFG